MFLSVSGLCDKLKASPFTEGVQGTRTEFSTNGKKPLNSDTETASSPVFSMIEEAVDLKLLSGENYIYEYQAVLAKRVTIN